MIFTQCRSRYLSTLLFPIFLIGLSQAGEIDSRSNGEQLSVTIPYQLESGWLDTPVGGESTVLILSETIIMDKGSPWLRLHFGQVELSGEPLPDEAYYLPMIKITSIEDGAFQTLSYKQLSQWRWTSACFNGDQVRLELFGIPGVSYRLSLTAVQVGLRMDCFTKCDTHSNFPSSHNAVARTFPRTCAAFLIYDGEKNSFVSSGLCPRKDPSVGDCSDYEDYLEIAMFNVPQNQDCTPKFPAPEHQYAIDPRSFHCKLYGNEENWAYFGVFPNSTTGLTPYEAQKAAFVIKATLPDPGEMLTRTGFSSNPDPTIHRTQQSSIRTVTEISSLVPPVFYTEHQVEVGTPGAPLYISEAGADFVYGLISGGYCESDPAFVLSFSDQNLQFAIANPKGAAIAEFNPPIVQYLSQKHPNYQIGDPFEVNIGTDPAKPFAPVHFAYTLNGESFSEVIGETDVNGTFIFNRPNWDCGVYSHQFKVGSTGDLSPQKTFTYHCSNVTSPTTGDQFQCKQAITMEYVFTGGGNWLDAQLLQEGSVVYNFPDRLPSSQTLHTLNLPDTEGTAFTIRLTDASDPNKYGESGAFSIICTLPDPPTNLQASYNAYPDRIELNWDHVTFNGFYKVFRSNLPGCCNGGIFLGNSFFGAYTDNDPNLDPGKNYYYWVTRYDLSSTLESLPSDVKVGRLQVPSGNVVFPDSVLKADMVDKYDYDGDGEVSFQEASAVRYLGFSSEVSAETSDFTGIEHFSGARTVTFINMRALTNLTSFPKNVESITIHNCPALRNILSFPTTLTGLGCSSAPLLAQFPRFPDGILSIGLVDVGFTSLPPLPGLLQNLTVKECQLTQLPNLPANLKTLVISDNLFTSFPNLPPNLETFWADGNFFTEEDCPEILEAQNAIPNFLVNPQADGTSLDCNSQSKERTLKTGQSSPGDRKWQ